MSTPDKAFEFGTKAATLERLAPHLTRARLCQQVAVPVERWRNEPEAMLAEIMERFGSAKLAIRSSAANEDGWENSQAGAHLSLIDTQPSREAISSSIDDVFESYKARSADDQVLVQPMVENVVISGVVLTRDLDAGGPYYAINYDDVSGRTDTVTGGAESKTIFVHRSKTDALKSPRFRRLIDSVIELEAITGSRELDIEFCIDGSDQVFILQVRPLAARKRWRKIPIATIDAAIDRARDDIAMRMTPQPGLAGATTIFGEMTDWNPAEMIGTAPRPLALTLYRRLITDGIWAQARAAMGYRMVEAPLLVTFCGRPYIDVRLSFNSFIPAGIADDIAEHVVDHQLSMLSENRDLHDKIEFEIALTCRDFAYPSARGRLGDAGLNADALSQFDESLGALTRRALAAVGGEMADLLGRTESLLGGRSELSGLPPLERARRLLDDCKASGTLPFSMLARHGFIGMQFLGSLVKRGVFSQDDAERFMRGIHTIATDIVQDMCGAAAGRIALQTFLERYGHLRPGTYDITSSRYDENPDLFMSNARRQPPATLEPFQATPRQLKEIGVLLRESGYDVTPDALLDYIAMAVRAREQAKFAFTRNISDALSILVEWGEGRGLSRHDLAFLPIEAILAGGDKNALEVRMAEERETYGVNRTIRLPHLICEPSDIDVVRLPLGHPTFITGESVSAPARRLEATDPSQIEGCIVMIESADPGFDWIFSHSIAGLITKYGGANSHMAIRCAEFGLPAAIGCGDQLFASLLKAPVIELNCAARKVSGH